jgi:hypothetical protein
MVGDADDPKVPIVCTVCDTTARVPLESVGERVRNHNARMHDGDPVAEIDPEIRRAVADMVAEDLDLS